MFQYFSHNFNFNILVIILTATVRIAYMTPIQNSLLSPYNLGCKCKNSYVMDTKSIVYEFKICCFHLYFTIFSNVLLFLVILSLIDSIK